MRIHATSCIEETGLKIFNGFLIFFNGFSIFLNGFLKSSMAFRFLRNLRKSIYGKKYTKDHYLSFVFFATCSPTCAPSFPIPATIPNSHMYQGISSVPFCVVLTIPRTNTLLEGERPCSAVPTAMLLCIFCLWRMKTLLWLNLSR